MRNSYKIFVGKPEKKLFERTRRRWEEIIRMDHREVLIL
jgi:hypothetical protein